MSDSQNNITPLEQAQINFSTGLGTSGVLSGLNGWNSLGSNPNIYFGSESAHKWGGGTAGTGGGTVYYYFDPGSGFTQSVENMYISALTLWSDLSNISFVQTTIASQAQLSLYLFNTSTPNVPLDNGAYATAISQPGTAGSSQIPATQAVSISIEQSGSWAQLSSFTYFGGYGPSTIVHELGHAIGLMHTGPYNGAVNPATQQYTPYDSYLWSIMSYISASDKTAKYYNQYPVQGSNYSPQISSSTPQMLDILGAQQLYGLPTSTTFTSGGQVFGFNCNISDAAEPFYDFTKNTQPVVTIWDSGSGNTLDLSGFFTSSVVNLNPGTFSSADGMTNNIGIAYNTWIDTVIGGAGNDTFLVNSQSDTINGGGGTNTAVFSFSYAAYVITALGGGSYSVSNGAETDTLSNIQTLAFADQVIAVSALPTGDRYRWNTGNGSFSVAGSWTDTTTGEPATTPPGATNVALIPGPTSGGPQTISGNGTAAQLVFTGLTGVTGTLATGQLTVGQGNGATALVTIAPGADITAASAAVDNGTLKVNGTLETTNILSLAPVDAASTAVLDMRTGGYAQVGGLVLNGGTVAVDATSLLEIGTVGSLGTGVAQIDPGFTVSGNGSLPYPVDNGTIIATGGTLSITSLLGTGAAFIASDGVLKLGNSTSVPITFNAGTDGSTGTLALNITGGSESVGVVSGFVPGSDIAITALTSNKPQALTQPVYNAQTGAFTVESVGGYTFSGTFAGNYSGKVFLLTPTGTGQFGLIVSPGTLNGSQTPSSGTAQGAVFAWQGSTINSDWNTAANWGVVNTNVGTATTAMISPGSNDTAFIQGALLPNQVQVISGNANVNELLFAGANAYSGSITVATSLGVGQIGNPSSLALIGTAAVTANGIQLFADSALDVASNTSVSATKTLTISSDPSQTIAPLEIYGGGIVQAGALSLSGSAAPIALDSASILEVGTVGGAQVGALTVDSGNTVSGSGDLSALGIVDNGSITASGGLLKLGGVIGTGTLSIANNATLGLAASEANLIDFAGADATLQVNKSFATLGTVVGFTQGETIAVAALPQALPTNVTYTATGAGLGTLSLTNGFSTQVQMTLAGTFSPNQFILNTESASSLATLTLACFAAGTCIATPRGEVAVETLRRGDLVHTQFAGRAQPIVWIGHRRVDCRRHPAPQRVWPVRVQAGCFGPGLPARDLFLSPDHAVFVDDVLVPVKHLINGTTIKQIKTRQVTYYHLELARHDVVSAEGLPAESYLDTGDRGNFSNGGNVVSAYPDFVIRSWEAEGCAPLVVTGPALEAVRQRIRRRRDRRRAA